MYGVYGWGNYEVSAFHFAALNTGDNIRTKKYPGATPGISYEKS